MRRYDNSPAIVMYLIQCKSDGKYWSNGGPTKGVPKDELRTGWRTSPVHCRPFKNISGAKTSNGWISHKYIHITEDCDRCKSGQKHDLTGWPWKRIRLSEDELPNQLVAVKVQISIK